MNNHFRLIIETLYQDYLESPECERSDGCQRASDEYGEVLDRLKERIGGIGESKLFSDLDCAVGAYSAGVSRDAYQAGFKAALSLMKEVAG